MSSRRLAPPVSAAAGDALRVLLAVAMSVALALLTPADGPDPRIEDTPVWLALTVAGCAPIALRRAVPVVAAALSLSVPLLGVALGYDALTGPIIVALGLVALAASRTEPRRTLPLAAYSAAVISAIALTDGDAGPVASVIAGVAVGTLPAVIGERLRAERARTRDARELARRVEELRDHDVQRAVAEERLRIARDVHDVTGHHLSGISLQAAGAGRTTQDPQARAAFERIHGLTVEALGQTRRALGVLREGSEPAELAPPPSLAHVDRLLEPARAAGIAVDLRIEGRARELSETAELCAYRVIQESLTNVVRHAGARSVGVVVGYGEDALTLAVDDDGVGAGDRPVRPGGGIAGMRERIAIVAGELAVGPRAGGGWSVRATLPLEGAR